MCHEAFNLDLFPMRNLLKPAVLLIIPLLLSSAVSAERLIRWVDKEGKVHYSDRVPVEHIDNARSELNARGVEIRKTDAAKTAEQIAQEKELARLRVEQQRLIEEQRARDRVLLRSFRSSDDILMTRDGKLTAIDTSILVTRSNIKRLKLKLTEMQKKAANLERQGKNISDNVLKDIEGTRQQLKDGYATIIRKEQDKEGIRIAYAADLARFRALKNLHPDQDEAAREQKRRSLLLETVVLCSDQQSCDAAWEQAEAYVRSHATTRLQMLAESIIMTSAPAKDQDISITVSRIEQKNEPGAQLFMDLQCKDSPRGREFCETDQVNQIRSGFRVFLGAQAGAEPSSASEQQPTASSPIP